LPFFIFLVALRPRYAKNVAPTDNPTKTNNGVGASNSENIGNAFLNPTNTPHQKRTDVQKHERNYENFPEAKPSKYLANECPEQSANQPTYDLARHSRSLLRVVQAGQFSLFFCAVRPKNATREAVADKPTNTSSTKGVRNSPNLDAVALKPTTTSPVVNNPRYISNIDARKTFQRRNFPRVLPKNGPNNPPTNPLIISVITSLSSVINLL
jgi:hypothetical protein